ncbi:MAG: TonB-dependent receptor [Bacteroidota bacterium]
MKKIIAICFSLISLFICSSWIAVEDPFKALLKKLEEFTINYPTEKVHLHLDKPYYAIGDDIWFKAYVVDGRTLEPTTMSNVLYVELIDENDSLKNRLKIPMNTGTTWGDFKLSDTISDGNYRIRAYTQLMRNAGPEFFFDKIIKIGNSWANKVFLGVDHRYSQEGTTEKINTTIRFVDSNSKPYINTAVNYVVELGISEIKRAKVTTNDKGEINIVTINPKPETYKSGKITANIILHDKQIVTKIIPIKATSTTIDVQFFPEGGSLIQDLPSKIAIKSINAEGKGEDVKGIIIDNEGTEITTFETTYLGMGSFSLNPLSGKTYQAKVKFKDGAEKLVNLPKIESSGYILNVNSTDTAKIEVKILTSEALIGKGDLQLLAQQNGKVYFSVKIPAAKNFATVNLPKSDFLSGISTLTLFNAEQIPVAERLIFVNSQLDKIKIDITNLKENVGKRELMSLNLFATNQDKPTQASFSIAITNTAAVEPDLDNETHILTSLLLKSDLKGYIEKPNHYFISTDAKTQTNLDNLLLTQGWRKIDWAAISRPQLVTNNFKAEKGIQINGTVNTYGGKPIPNAKVSLFTTSIGILAIDTLTDANGRFSFNNLMFTDSAKFVINAINENGNRNNVELKLDVIPGQRITRNLNTADIEVNVNEQLKNYLKNSEDYFLEQTKKGILTRTIQLNKVNIIGQKKKNLKLTSTADKVYTSEDLKNVVSLRSFLEVKLTTLKARNMGGNPTFIIDGAYLPDFNYDLLIPDAIESIEILTSPSNLTRYGGWGINGIVLITSKSGGYFLDKATIVQNPINYNTIGFSTPRQFYSPRYDIKLDTKPDLRTTVYWNPAVVSNEEGKFKLDYFNTDESGLYRVVIEGIDLMGNIGRKTFTYEVK